ncbi:MAG: efflux RND transporter permease subunit, partial [Bacteroidota bacterium]
ELYDPEEFGAIIVSQKENDLVRLRDVAEVTVGAADERTVARYNGQPAVGLGIVKQSKASTVDVAAVVRAALPGLTNLLPEGMKLDVAYDSSTFINESIDEVTQTLIIAMCLVVLVVLAFLKSFRATTIPTVAIPISIIGAFAAAYFAGFTINILTLLALVLAIGIVVDDAIVMLENVYRHMEMGKTRWQAAVDGSKEIGFVIVATTVTLVAVFIPLAFLTGSVGRLFNEFGLSLAVAILISGFVALTLTPMLCSKILRPLHHTGTGWASRSFDAFFEWMNRIYDRILRVALRRRRLMIAGAVFAVLLSVIIFKFMPSELVPVEDRSIGFGIVIA